MPSTKGEPKFKVGDRVTCTSGYRWVITTSGINFNGRCYDLTAEDDGRRAFANEPYLELTVTGATGNVVFGATCLRCREYCAYAEAAPGFKCFSCRSRGA